MRKGKSTKTGLLDYKHTGLSVPCVVYLNLYTNKGPTSVSLVVFLGAQVELTSATAQASLFRQVHVNAKHACTAITPAIRTLTLFQGCSSLCLDRSCGQHCQRVLLRFRTMLAVNECISQHPYFAPKISRLGQAL